MFLQLQDEKTTKRLLLNLDTTFCIIETDNGGAAAVSIHGHTAPLPIAYEPLAEAIAAEQQGDALDELPETD